MTLMDVPSAIFPKGRVNARKSQRLELEFPRVWSQGEAKASWPMGRLWRSHGRTSWGSHISRDNWWTPRGGGGSAHQPKAVLAANSRLSISYITSAEPPPRRIEIQLSFFVPPSCFITSSTTPHPPPLSPLSGSSDCRLETKPSKLAQPHRHKSHVRGRLILSSLRYVPVNDSLGNVLPYLPRGTNVFIH